MSRKNPVYGHACAATLSYVLAALGRLEDPRVITLVVIAVVTTFFIEKHVLAYSVEIADRGLAGAAILALVWFPQFALITLVRAILDGAANTPNRMPVIWFSIYEWLFLFSGAFITAWIDIGVRQWRDRE